ncbi:MAG: NAD(P)/FAD-dependent oxidoreductase [Desulfosarcinaceae bacterium]|nr:NAD(P)/FAD-dependent oxidoreductase [Desulfosarcinaceae bacterium]
MTVKNLPDDNHAPVLIVGGGIAGLACARHLHTHEVAVEVLEASRRVGGRIKTDQLDGYLLDRGFQVLQTAYPDARRMLDYGRLNLQSFAPGVRVRIGNRFYTLADPLRRPWWLMSTLGAPIGGLMDRIRLLRLTLGAALPPMERLFSGPELESMHFLREQGFSDPMIQRFFVPFFGGVCLDRRLRASSRVLRYVVRMFARGEAALPTAGMEAIPRQLASHLPEASLRTGARVRRVTSKGIILDDGSQRSARAVVIATGAPMAEQLLERPPRAASVAETCLYFACNRAAWHSRFLLLNGTGEGPINNLCFPSSVSAAYAPSGKSLAAVVVLGSPPPNDATLIAAVRAQLTAWFGSQVQGWRHLRSYHIAHALPSQRPPTESPYRSAVRIRSGIYRCGELDSLPGIQWALLSGRRTAEAVLRDLKLSGPN